jgi:hypothetical protein
MRKWCWLVAAATLSCNSPKRDFVSTGDAGASGQPTSRDNGGAPNGGTPGGGAPNGGTPNAGDAGDAGATNDAGGGGNGTTDPNCEGCSVGNACIPNGAVNPRDPCQICDTAVASDSYSPNEGALCGSEESACSAQDTCNASGDCAGNHFDDGLPCAGGACEAGVCNMQPNPFDCIAPSPPKAELTGEPYGFEGAPPSAKGGTIVDGRYTAVRFDQYDSDAGGVDVWTFEFRKGYVQAEMRYWTFNDIAYIPEVQFAGSFATDGTTLTFDVDRCDPQYDIDMPTFSYTVTSNGLITIAPLTNGGTIVVSFLRE